jgi:hypothetical protein
MPCGTGFMPGTAEMHPAGSIPCVKPCSKGVAAARRRLAL